MSTKIFNAYRIVGSLYDFTERLQEYKKQRETWKRWSSLEDICIECCINYSKYKPLDGQKFPFNDIHRNYYEDYVNYKNQYGVHYIGTIFSSVQLSKYDLSYVLYSTPDALYLQLFSQDARQTYDFVHFFGHLLSDFSYWDNTDKPEDLSETEWNARKKVWNFIFYSSPLPCKVGICEEMEGPDDSSYFSLDIYRSASEEKQREFRTKIEQRVETIRKYQCEKRILEKYKREWADSKYPHKEQEQCVKVHQKEVQQLLDEIKEEIPGGIDAFLQEILK